VVLQLTVFWYIGAVLGHVCLGLGVLALVTMLLSWVFFFPQWGLGVCVVLWSVGCKSIQFLVHSFNPRRAVEGQRECQGRAQHRVLLWCCSQVQLSWCVSTPRMCASCNLSHGRRKTLG
jgi:membrane protein required for beta-lactamase induction